MSANLTTGGDQTAFRRGIRPPTRRPRWVTVLAVLMLLAGARLFLGSLTDLRRLVTGRSMAEIRLDGSGRRRSGSAHPRADRPRRGGGSGSSGRSQGAGCSPSGAGAGVSFRRGSGVFRRSSGSPCQRACRPGPGWLCTWAAGYSCSRWCAGVADTVPVLQQVAAQAHARAGDAPPASADLAQLASTLMIQVPLLSARAGRLVQRPVPCHLRWTPRPPVLQ